CNPLLYGAAQSTCESTAPIPPGACIQVTGCTISGTKAIYVNTPDPPGDTAPGPVAESAAPPPGPACGNNWSIAHNGATCNCSASSSAQALRPVAMFLVLDN